jgi:hypothetical protein
VVQFSIEKCVKAKDEGQNVTRLIAIYSDANTGIKMRHSIASSGTYCNKEEDIA